MSEHRVLTLIIIIIIIVPEQAPGRQSMLCAIKN